MYVDPAALGRGYVCLLRAIGAVPDIGAAPARHEAIAMAAAVTGADNVLMMAVTASPAALFDYLTGPFAVLNGVDLNETVAVHRIVKGATAATPRRA